MGYRRAQKSGDCGIRTWQQQEWACQVEGQSGHIVGGEQGGSIEAGGLSIACGCREKGNGIVEMGRGQQVTGASKKL
jgi:hypothetical protein